MQRLRMVPVLRADGSFHARVVAARLGAEGIVTQLRGNVDGPYPMGAVEVLVTEEDLPAARELLLADEVESSFEDAPDPLDATERTVAPSYGPWLLVVALAVATVVPMLAVYLR